MYGHFSEHAGVKNLCKRCEVSLQAHFDRCSFHEMHMYHAECVASLTREFSTLEHKALALYGQPCNIQDKGNVYYLRKV